jgi:hypothetical protein
MNFCNPLTRNTLNLLNMKTALMSNECLATRQFAGNFMTGSLINRWHAPSKCVIEIPEQQGFFNVFSNSVRTKALLSFGEELQKSIHKIKRFNPEDLVTSFTKILSLFLELSTSAIHSQITSVNSLVLKAETSSGNIYTELFFDENTGWLNEVAVNIINDRQLEFSNTGSLDAMILAIKQYFGKEEINYFTILNQATAYDLSGTALATADF